MKQEIEWHPYPETPLPETKDGKEYLVTMKSDLDEEIYVCLLFGGQDFSESENEIGATVLAWAEPPEPYTGDAK